MKIINVQPDINKNFRKEKKNRPARHTGNLEVVRYRNMWKEGVSSKGPLSAVITEQ